MNSPAPTAQPSAPTHLELTQKERELILALRYIRFWQFQKEKSAVLLWSGAYLRVMESVQVKNGA